MIDIVRASAGSGKTFTLAKKYITLLMESADPFAYRHILAVTFTNKATDEMKSRILKELHILAQRPQDSGYFQDLLPRFSSPALLQKKAGDILTRILHDYSAFSVSTIDKFFQRTLKAFAREIGQFPSYRVELDKDSLVKESVDRILDALDDRNKTLLNWLIDSAEECIFKGDRFQIEKGLYEAAAGIKSDEFTHLVKENGIDLSEFYSKSNLADVRKACDAFIDQYRQQLAEAAGRIWDGFTSAGVALEDTNRHFMASAVNFYLSLAAGDEEPAYHESFMKNVAASMNGGSPESWFSKKNSHMAARLGQPCLQAVADLYRLLEQPFHLFSTLQTIRKQSYNLGIVKEINDEFQAVLKEKNVVSIDETNDILNRIIAGTEAPFIYEKLGVRFENFLLDEFQDTSVVQWENFKPLIEESQSNGNGSLIVGDVKQSIYRWRGGDWNLLASGVQNSVRGPLRTSTLDTNWRSCRNIITFNNSFFQFAKERLEEREHVDGKVLDALYADVVQKVSTKMQQAGEDRAGSVEVTFTEDEMQEIAVSIGKVLDAGGNYGQIAILVRNNKQGSEIAKMLTSRNIPVISDDALLVRSSSVVARLVALLYYIDTDYAERAHPSKKRMVNTYLAEQLAVEIPENYGSLADLCEGLLRGLREHDPEMFRNEVAYVEAFMDELKDWTSNNGNNLRAFLTYWEGVNPKLSSPDASDAVTIFTVHKSKGLEFDYVIFPYTEEVTLYTNEETWCIPDFSQVASTRELDFLGRGAYQVTLSGKSARSLFAEQYVREFFMQTVDNLNVFYVALTRAKKGIHLISCFPSRDFLKSFEKDGTLAEPLDFNKIMYAYLHLPEGSGLVQDRPAMEDSPLPLEYQGTEYAGMERESRIFGHFYDYGSISGVQKSGQVAESNYPSYALNPVSRNSDGEEVRQERLAFSSDAADFFGEDGTVGVEASNRIRGTVLHQILSLVVVPSDLDRAVQTVMRQGLIDPEQAEEARQELLDAIFRVQDMGWFPEDGKGVRNETSIYDAQGNTYRPDRLLLRDGEAVVVDYKFGEPEPKYRKQVSRYASLLKDAGYQQVKAYLWYVGEREKNIDQVV